MLRFVLFILLMFFSISGGAWAVEFSKVVHDKDSMVGVFIAIPVIIVINFIFLIFYWKKNKLTLSEALIHPSKQRGQLVDAFSRLEKAIGERDVELRDDVASLNNISEAKTRMIVNVSHEIRSPMHAILSLADLGIRKSESGDVADTKKCFAKIENSGKRLLTVINWLLDMSGVESGNFTFRPELHDINCCIDEAEKDINSLIMDKEINLELKKDVNIEPFYFDKVLIGLVVKNLLSNAIKFSLQGGNISLEAKKIKIDNNNEGVRVVVADEGVGIPENELKIIFEKYNQSSAAKTNNIGCGIGLAICKELVNSHDGFIWAENNKPQGSIFSFVIPYKVCR